MNGDQFIRPEVAKKREATKKLMDSVQDKLVDSVNTTDFPFWIIPKIKELGVNGCQIKDFGGPGFTNLETGVISFEMAKIDASISTFFLVHNAIG